MKHAIASFVLVLVLLVCLCCLSPLLSVPWLALPFPSLLSLPFPSRPSLYLFSLLFLLYSPLSFPSLFPFAKTSRLFPLFSLPCSSLLLGWGKEGKGSATGLCVCSMSQPLDWMFYCTQSRPRPPLRSTDIDPIFPTLFLIHSVCANVGGEDLVNQHRTAGFYQDGTHTLCRRLPSLPTHGQHPRRHHRGTDHLPGASHASAKRWTSSCSGPQHL